MKKKLLLACAFCCTVLAACQKNFKIDEQTFSFNSLNGEKRKVRLVLPSDYKPPQETTVRYPTVYLLHGAGTDSTELDNIAKTAKDFMEDLYPRGEVGKMIIVIPDAMTTFRGNPAGSFYTNSPATGDFKTYITPELVDLIDANFSTIKDRSQRAITGESMGGYGAIFLALQSPGNELFSSTASHSGLLCFEEMLPLLADPPIADDYIHNHFVPLLDTLFCPGMHLSPQKENDELRYNEEAWQQWLEHDPWTFLEKNPTAFDDFQVYVDCGAHDELGLTAHAEKFAKKLDSLGVRNQFLIYEYHTGANWLDRWLSGHWFIKWRFGESLKFHWRHFNRM